MSVQDSINEPVDYKAFSIEPSYPGNGKCYDGCNCVWCSGAAKKRGGYADTNQQRCLRTWKFEDGIPLREHLTHATLGLSSEAGEFASLVDKILYKPNKVVTDEMLVDELGDALYNITVLAYLLGLNIQDLYNENAKKLKGGHGWVNETDTTKEN